MLVRDQECLRLYTRAYGLRPVTISSRRPSILGDVGVSPSRRRSGFGELSPERWMKGRLEVHAFGDIKTLQ